MALNLGVDAWNLTGDRRGIGRYVREVVRRWAAWGSRVRISLLVPEWPAWLVRGRYLQELAGLELPVRHRTAARSLDAVWYPWNGMSWVPATLSVATLHDASLFSLPPHDDRLREREQRPFRVAAATAARIITLSQFSKTELVRYLGLDPAKVDVVNVGVNDGFSAAGAKRNLAAHSAEPAASSRYLLFVGEPEERKGVATLLEAMTLLPADLRAETELIIAGATGQYPLPSFPNSVKVRNVGWVDDETLLHLYANAAALVYPSVYEGFGLPIVEAMAAGAPVIAADVPGPREAGGCAALYVHAGDAAALAGAIRSVLTEPAVAGRLSQLGVERARQLTWEETARQTLAVIEKARAEAKSR